MNTYLPPLSGDTSIESPADLLGRTVTCLLTNGIALVCIRVEGLDTYWADLRLAYSVESAAPSASRVALRAIGHMHVYGTAANPEPIFDPAWYVHLGQQA